MASPSHAGFWLCGDHSNLPHGGRPMVCIGFRPHRKHWAHAAYCYRCRRSVVCVLDAPLRCAETAEPITTRPSFTDLPWIWISVNISVDKKGSPYSITERRVPELIPVLGSQPAGYMSHKPGGRLPILSARPAVTPATLNRAATNFAARWTEARWVWTVCLRLLHDSVATAHKICGYGYGYECEISYPRQAWSFISLCEIIVLVQRFMQYLASNNCSFNLDAFSDKATGQGSTCHRFPTLVCKDQIKIKLKLNTLNSINIRFVILRYL